MRAGAYIAAVALGLIFAATWSATALADNCFAPDVGAASPDRGGHYKWALARNTSELESNLGKKIGLLFACAAQTDQQLEDTFADLSLVIARNVPDASCFGGDTGVVNTDRSFHRAWAARKSRDQMAQNAKWKALAALKCLDRTKQTDFFADVSVVLAAASAPPEPTGFTVCNKTGQQLSVAYASVTHGVASQITATIWGWYSVSDGQCTVLNRYSDPMPNTMHWYVYARSGTGTWSGRGRSSAEYSSYNLRDDMGYTWNVSMDLCTPDTPDGAPSFDDLSKSCSRIPFFMVDPRSGGTSYTYTFTP